MKLQLQQLLLLQLLLLLPLSSTTTTTRPTPSNCTPNLNTIYDSTTTASEGITKLGVALLKEFGVQENILVSPLSIWTVLGLVLVGAEGKTESSMSAALGVKNKAGILDLLKKLERSLETAKTAGNDKSSKVSLDIANRIYLQTGLQINKCKDELKDMVVQLNLEEAMKAADTINKYVNTTTQGLIPEIISEDKLGPLARMVVINAVYFKGTWAHPFNSSFTAHTPFYRHPDLEPESVETMFTPELPVMVGYSQELEAQVLRLNYSGEFAMTVLLPHEQGEAALNATLKALTTTALWKALKDVKLGYYDVYMPKFSINSTFEEDLKTALKNMGITDLFTLAANLSAFRDDLFVKHIMHKTLIQVDEKGTTAAASTAAVIFTKTRKIIRLNRPFFFVVHDNANVLFLGAYRGPQ